MAWNMCGPKPAEKKVVTFRQSNRTLSVDLLLFECSDGKHLANRCMSESPTIPQVFKTPPLFSVKLGAILKQYASLVTDKSWWGTGTCV